MFQKRVRSRPRRSSHDRVDGCRLAGQQGVGRRQQRGIVQDGIEACHQNSVHLGVAAAYGGIALGGSLPGVHHLVEDVTREASHKGGEMADLRIEVFRFSFVDRMIGDFKPALGGELGIGRAAGEDDLVVIKHVDGDFQPVKQAVAFEEGKIFPQIVEAGVGLEHDKADIGFDAVAAQNGQSGFVLGDGGVFVQPVEGRLAAALEPDEDIREAGIHQSGDHGIVNIVGAGLNAEGDGAFGQKGRQAQHPVPAGFPRAEEIGIGKIKIAVIGLGDDHIDLGGDVFRRAAAPARAAGRFAVKGIDIAKGAVVVAPAAAEDVYLAAGISRGFANGEGQGVQILHRLAEGSGEASVGFAEGEAGQRAPVVQMLGQGDDGYFVFAEHRRIDGRAAGEHLRVGKGGIIAVGAQMGDGVLRFKPRQEIKEPAVVLPVIDQMNGEQLRAKGGDFGLNGLEAQVFHIPLDQFHLVAVREQSGRHIAGVQAGGQGGVGDVVAALLRGHAGMFE